MKAMLLNLTHYSLFKVRGENAKTFLQGQLTADMEKVDDKHLSLTGYCDPKGRLWSIMRVFKHNHDFYFHLPKEIMQTTLEDLSKYALFSNVSVQTVPDYESVAIIGENQQPIADTVIQLKIDNTRMLLVGSKNELNTLSTEKNSITLWNLSEIRAGIPTVWQQTIGKLLPHDINLIDLNAVSFTKGCYKGQEIIARMQYRGQRKKHMVHRILNTDSCPIPGEKLTEGEVVSSALSENGCELLIIQPIHSLRI